MLPLNISPELQEAIEAAREDLLAFCLLMCPHFAVGPHLRIMADSLMQVYYGDTKRLMIFMPPRSGKSFMTSIYFPAWCIGKNPYWQMMSLTHTSTLAEDWSAEIRNIVNDDLYQMIFPGTQLRPDSRAKNRWHTNRSGVFTAAAVGRKIAGRGANLAIIDDPISEQDAYSKSKLEAINRWYPGGLRSRLMPNGRIVITNTRWNSNDLSGHLLSKALNDPEADNWEIIEFPALNTKETAEQLELAREILIDQGLLPESYPHMVEGETYWPPVPEADSKDYGLAGWATAYLRKTKANTPPHDWEALYMQRPVAEEGNILKRNWWKNWAESDPPTCEYVLISWDTAYTEKEYSDYTAYTVWGIFRKEAQTDKMPNMILLGGGKGRYEYPALRRMAKEVYQQWQPDAMIIEKKASGISLIQDLIMSGIPVLPFDPHDKDKIARAYAATPYFHGGCIWAPVEKRWAADIIFECSAFPAGEYDDYVDTVTQAVLWVSRGSWLIHPDDADLYDDDERGKLPKYRTYWSATSNG